MSEYFIAWWNVENLYDVMPWEERARKIRNLKDLKTKLKDWDDNTLDMKLGQLTEIIKEMNNSAGPDILGVCEIENKDVLNKLVSKVKTDDLANRNYDIVHHDSPDPRGIDIAFIYDKSLFDFHIKDPNAPEGSDARRYWFSHEVIKRYPTRDIFQVNFQPKDKRDKPFVLIGNHWPSRMDGVYESEPYRIIAAETLSYYNLRIQQELGEHTPILVMGDFNDDPGSRSMTDYALSSRNIAVVTNTPATTPRLLNLMWPLMDSGCGTFWYEGPLFFDQFLVSKGFLVKDRTFSVVENSVKVISPTTMWERPPPRGRYPQPREFGWKPRNPLGFSDHFPITLKIREID